MGESLTARPLDRLRNVPSGPNELVVPHAGIGKPLSLSELTDTLGRSRGNALELGGTATAAVASAAVPDAAADEQAVRAINPAWFTAYNAHDVEGVVSLYADDAVVNVPGAAPSRGKAAIRQAYTKEIGDFAAAGLSQTSSPTGEFGVSGDLGYEANTFTVTDKSGKTVDKGKYVSVFARKNGKWLIIQDIWNSDTPPAPAK